MSSARRSGLGGTLSRAGAATLVTACAVAGALAGCQHADASTEAEAKKTVPKIHVDTVSVTERSLPKLLTVTGVLEPDMRTNLSANAQGRVIRTFVERGDHVKAGQLLAQLDVRAAVLTQAEAIANAQSAADMLKNVRADCNRYIKLLERGAITRPGVRPPDDELRHPGLGGGGCPHPRRRGRADAARRGHPGPVRGRHQRAFRQRRRLRAPRHARRDVARR